MNEHVESEAVASVSARERAVTYGASKRSPLAHAVFTEALQRYPWAPRAMFHHLPGGAMPSFLLKLTLSVAVLLVAASCGTACPDGTTSVNTCLACGPTTDQCMTSGVICATPCNSSSDCGLPYQCIGGLCQPVPCL
jgi:hypothetical protein